MEKNKIVKQSKKWFMGLRHPCITKSCSKGTGTPSIHFYSSQVPDIGAHFTSTGLGEDRCGHVPSRPRKLCSTRGRLNGAIWSMHWIKLWSRVFLVVWQIPKPGTTMRKSVTPQKTKKAVNKYQTNVILCRRDGLAQRLAQRARMVPTREEANVVGCAGQQCW